jgi:hypothetical protein
MARRERNIRLLPVVLVGRHAGDVHVELIAASANGGNIGFAVIPGYGCNPKTPPKRRGSPGKFANNSS